MTEEQDNEEINREPARPIVQWWFNLRWKVRLGIYKTKKRIGWWQWKRVFFSRTCIHGMALDTRGRHFHFYCNKSRFHRGLHHYDWPLTLKFDEQKPGLVLYALVNTEKFNINKRYYMGVDPAHTAQPTQGDDHA